MADAIPPPPAGFTLDSASASAVPPPPAGFTLDGAAPPQAATPAQPEGAIQHGVKTLAQGFNRNLMGGPVASAIDILPYYASKAMGASEEDAARPAHHLFEKYLYPDTPTTGADKALDAAGGMVGANVPLVGAAAGAARAGIRAAVPLAEQAGTGIAGMLARLRGAGDSVLDTVAAKPVGAVVGDTGSAALSGGGGEVQRQAAEKSGAGPTGQALAEAAGQIGTPALAATYARFAPSVLAAKGIKAGATKVAQSLPEDAVPAWAKPDARSFEERAAERNDYANREGRFANPDEPAPKEPGWFTRQQDLGAAQRTEKAKTLVGQELGQVVNKPESAANIAEADRLKAAIPGFNPSIAKSSGDPALLNLQGKLEGESTGNDLRAARDRRDASVGAIQQYRDTQVPEVPKPPALVVARQTPTGEVRYGQPGQVHSDLMSREEMATASTPPDVEGSMGFAQPGGRFLSREDALKFATANEPARAAYSNQQPQFGLEASKYQDAPGTTRPPQDIVATANRGRVRDVQSGIEQQQNTTNAQLRQMTDTLPPEDRIATGDALRTARAGAEEASNRETTRLRQAIAAPDTPVQVGQQQMTVNAALDRQTAINQQLRDYNSATARSVEDVRQMRALQDERGRINQALEGVNLPGMQEYRAYYRDQHVPQFGEGAGRDTGRYDQFGYGKNKVADEKVAGRFFNPNEESAARQFDTATGHDPQARQSMVDNALGDLRHTAIDPATGVLREGAVNRWLQKNERVLAQMPQTGAEIRAAVQARNPDALYQRLGQLEQRQRTVADTKVSQLLGRNPEQHIDAALNDWQVMKGLRSSVRGDPQAEAALTRAVWDRAPDINDPAKLQSWIEGHRRTLTQVLTPAHMTALDNIVKAAQIENRLPRPKGATEQLGTAADKVAGATGLSVQGYLSRALNVAKGYMSKEYAATDIAMRVWHNSAGREVDAAWKEALTNPKIASDLSAISTAKSATPIQLRRLYTYLLTTGAVDAGGMRREAGQK